MQRKDGNQRRSRREAFTVEELSKCSVVDSVTGCWNWTLSLNIHGYGQATHKAVHWGAHRLMFHLLHPSMNLKGKSICHHCDNRRCINPEHLYAGTPLSNMRDMINRGRQKFTGCPGERHPSAKLTEEQVREIRKRNAAGEGYRKLATIYGIDRTGIQDIVKRRTWKCVT